MLFCHEMSEYFLIFVFCLRDGKIPFATPPARQTSAGSNVFKVGMAIHRLTLREV